MEALLQLKVVEILSGRFGSASQAGAKFWSRSTPANTSANFPAEIHDLFLKRGARIEGEPVLRELTATLSQGKEEEHDRQRGQDA
jgi:hypothetical protein